MVISDYSEKSITFINPYSGRRFAISRSAPADEIRAMRQRANAARYPGDLQPGEQPVEDTRTRLAKPKPTPADKPAPVDAEPYVPLSGAPAYRAEKQKLHDEWRARRDAAIRRAREIEDQDRLADKIAAGIVAKQQSKVTETDVADIKQSLRERWALEDAETTAAREQRDAIESDPSSTPEQRAAARDAWAKTYFGKQAEPTGEQPTPTPTESGETETG